MIKDLLNFEFLKHCKKLQLILALFASFSFEILMNSFNKRMQKQSQYFQLHMWRIHNKEKQKAYWWFYRKAYHRYFQVKLGDQDRSWAPYVVWKTCKEHIRQWTNETRKSLRFGIPMFGVSHRIIVMTATSVQLIQLDWTKRTINPKTTPALTLSFDLYHIQMKCWSHFSVVFL